MHRHSAASPALVQAAILARARSSNKLTTHVPSPPQPLQHQHRIRRSVRLWQQHRPTLGQPICGIVRC